MGLPRYIKTVKLTWRVGLCELTLSPWFTILYTMASRVLECPSFGHLVTFHWSTEAEQTIMWQESAWRADLDHLLDFRRKKKSIAKIKFAKPLGFAVRKHSTLGE